MQSQVSTFDPLRHRLGPQFASQPAVGQNWQQVPLKHPQLSLTVHYLVTDFEGLSGHVLGTGTLRVHLRHSTSRQARGIQQFYSQRKAPREDVGTKGHFMVPRGTLFLAFVRNLCLNWRFFSPQTDYTSAGFKDRPLVGTAPPSDEHMVRPTKVRPPFLARTFASSM